ncbi:MAG: DUF3347 domain-containing protein [Candidatus Latescibacteria bacterium]|nr:DUF3347 domain-containing protein [Candidatus Latescibacterota bacterium]NIM22403.1 DUF3347 domain-containing protein [Candidatus Latescibacterota bacterium]NIO01274.1 DUF3347 domain-containing protein [Candidatus Latescibacterota bacterium]NIO27766.1 DUF3347 domain-containing protein [Candidatus Latescibacterota bacterium]NIO55313.1 DUF3347 domain-containing protein [Candidatus Latescibacterota bacterium]
MTMKNKSLVNKLRMPIAAIAILAVVFAIPASRHAILDFFQLGGETTEVGVYYTCPMHPEIRLPQMGDCPICGMSLVEKSIGEDEEEQTGVVSVTTRQIQLSGVTVEPVAPRKLVREIDTYGTIDYDETRLGVVSAWVGGRIDDLYVDFTGVTVNKGHPLVHLYSPDLISTEKEFLLAKENLSRVERSGLHDAISSARELVNASKQRLLWWGLSEAQIDKIARNGKIEDHITIYAPQGGTVTHKEAYEGMYVKEGDELFHIADLSKVWLFADIYEEDIPFLYQDRPDDFYECPMHPEVTSDSPSMCPKCGMDLIRTNKSIQAEITARAFPGEVFKGTISFTDPFLNPETRTVRVRVNIDNPELKLKPDMYARVQIKLPVGELLAVPENAVLHSGKRKIVLVEEEPGKFRPQPVELGRMWVNDIEREESEHKTLVFKREAIRYHEIIAGLNEGERVVTSGNFLLGSESKLQGALAKMLGVSDANATPADAHIGHSHAKPVAVQKEDKKEKHQGHAGREQAGDKKEKAEERPSKLEFVEEKAFAAIIDAYYDMADKLAGDKYEGISALADSINAKASSPSIKKAVEPLRHAHHKKDIEKIRVDFEGLSDMLIAYVQKHKAGIKDLPLKAYCPMKDASWLQKSKDIANPYYGSAMYKCGVIQAWEK